MADIADGELYAQRFQKLIYLHLFTDCFMKIFPQLSEQVQSSLRGICSHDWGEIFMKQSVNECR